MQKRHNPNTRTDTTELDIGQDQSHILAASGAVSHDDFIDEFDVVDTPDFKTIAERTAFFNEIVHVKILDDARPNAEQTIQTSVNGVNQFFIRGQVTKVKRMFLEVLARARPYNLSTPEYVDSTGNKATKINKTFGLSYPFQVLRDPNPDGPAWLERTLLEG